MLLLQHILCAFYLEPDLTNTEFLAGVMYPDAIRGFSVPRQCSHFETTNNDISYFVPKELVKKTYPYIKIDENINKWIKENNWSHLNDGPVNKENIENMYEEVYQKLTAKD